MRISRSQFVRSTRWLVVLLLLAVVVGEAQTRDYLSGGEVAAIGGGSLLVFGAGKYVNSFDSTRTAFWLEPAGWERSIQEFLGGDYYLGKTNFLDSDAGSAITPLAGMLLIGASDLGWVRDDLGKTFLQDQYLYATGLMATKAVTDLSKGLFRRRRPMAAMAPELMPPVSTY